MSVYDREPSVPRDDTGKGLRVIGWMLLAWTAFSLVWVPARVRSSTIALLAIGSCFAVGVLLVVVGYVVGWLTPYPSALAERTHDLMQETHSGSQLEEPLFARGDGPGLDPKRVA
ncbi:MAG: hypothetical protein ABIP81_09010 [Terriglobales bacterium]